LVEEKEVPIKDRQVAKRGIGLIMALGCLRIINVPDHGGGRRK
jgi:hypothetical protein